MKKISSFVAVPVLVFATSSVWAQPTESEAPAETAEESPVEEVASEETVAGSEGEDAVEAAPEAKEAASEDPAKAESGASAQVGVNTAPPLSTEPQAEEGATEEAAQAAEAPAEAAPDLPTSGYSKGLFLQSSDGKFKMVFGATLQARFTRTSEDTDMTDAEYGVNFSLPRARLTLKGHAYTPDLTYKFQSDFGKGSVSLKDLFFDYRLHDWVHVRVGQDKRPFSRQQVTSSTKQQFVDRAITDKAFGGGRDVGIQVHNEFTDVEGFGYGLGLYNGTGDSGKFSGSGTADLTTGEVDVESGKWSNVPGEFEPTFVLRLEWANGIKGYSESDLEGGDFRYALGASGLLDMNMDSSNDAKMRAEVDAIMKWQGWSVTGAYYISSTQTDRIYFEDRVLEATGAHLQGGYVIAGVVEPAARWATVKVRGPTDDEDVTTNAYTAGVNVFFKGHSVKWANDLTIALSESETSDTVTATEFRSQAQFSF